VHVGYGFTLRSFHLRLSCSYNSNQLSCTLFPSSLTSSVVLNDPVLRIHGVDSVKSTHVPYMFLPVNVMVPQLNMISASNSGKDCVVFNVIVDSGCSSHTFNCLNYIDNCKVMIEENYSSSRIGPESR